MTLSLYAYGTSTVAPISFLFLLLAYTHRNYNRHGRLSTRLLDLQDLFRFVDRGVFSALVLVAIFGKR